MTRNQITIPPPLVDFDYGGTLNFDQESDERVDQVTEFLENENWQWPSDIAQTDRGGRSRHVDCKNGERNARGIYDLGERSDQWFAEVMGQMPPPVWCDYGEVAEEIAKIKPNCRPCASSLYSKLSKVIEALGAKAADAGYDDNADIELEPHQTKDNGNTDLVKTSSLMAIWIYGKERVGLGGWPHRIEKALKESGLVFLAVPEDERRIPKCWQNWADRHGIIYHEVVSLTDNGSNIAQQAPGGRPRSIYQRLDDQTRATHKLLDQLHDKMKQQIDEIRELRKDVTAIKEQLVSIDGGDEEDDNDDDEDDDLPRRRKRARSSSHDDEGPRKCKRRG